jgi:hypothetical protein
VSDFAQRLIISVDGDVNSTFLDAVDGDLLLRTDIDRASRLTVKLRDPDRALRVLVHSPSEVAMTTAVIDSLEFQLAHVSTVGNELTLLFEDQIVSRLRAGQGRFSLKPGSVTFATFFARLAHEAGVKLTTAPACDAVMRSQVGRSLGTSTFNSWQAICDRAAQNGWRVFSDGGQLLVGPDSWLMGRKDDLDVSEGVGAVERIDFRISANSATHTAALRVRTADWSSLPGDPITVHDSGPADGTWLHASWSRGLSSDGYSMVKLIRPGAVAHGGVDDLTGRNLKPIDYAPQTAEVVQIDGSRVMAVPVGGDRQHPVGPCRGGKSGLRVGDLVLLVMTAHGPWVTTVDE